VRNFLKTGRIPILVDESHQVIQYFFLPLRQRHFTPLWAQREAYTLGEPKAKVNGTLGQVRASFPQPDLPRWALSSAVNKSRADHAAPRHVDKQESSVAVVKVLCNPLL